MNDFDNKLGQALSANGNYDEEKAAEQRKSLRDRFKASSRKVERIMWINLLIFTAVGAYCAVRLIFANNAQDAALFGVVLLVMVLNQRYVKLWYWVMNAKISILKELKLMRLSMASGSGQMDVLEDGEMEQLLLKPVAHGRGASKLEASLWYVAVLAVAIACALMAQTDVRNKMMMESMTAKELAVWHFDDSDTVKAVSQVHIDKSSLTSSKLSLTLPYSSGTLDSVTINGDDANFTEAGKGKYKVNLPAELLMVDKELEVQWSFPFTVFEKKEWGYRTVLKGLIPVKGYALKMVIEDNSKYEFEDWMKPHGDSPFSATYETPKQNMGSCSLGVRER